MAYQAIIFDLFDVIRQDTYKTWLRAHGFKREGAIGQASVDVDLGLIGREEFFQRLSKASGQPVAAIKAEFGRYSEYNHELIDIIRQLRQKYQIGLLSNGESTFVREVIRVGEMEDLFHHIVVSSEVGMKKPDPRVFRHALDKVGVQPSEAIFIDDNEHNVAAARELGIAGIQYKDMSSLRDELAKLAVAAD